MDCNSICKQGATPVIFMNSKSRMESTFRSCQVGFKLQSQNSNHFVLECDWSSDQTPSSTCANQRSSNACNAAFSWRYEVRPCWIAGKHLKRQAKQNEYHVIRFNLWQIEWCLAQTLCAVQKYVCGLEWLECLPFCALRWAHSNAAGCQVQALQLAPPPAK